MTDEIEVDIHKTETYANEILNEFKAFIDTEKLFIRKEHELKERLLSLEVVVGHLDENIPLENKVEQALNDRIGSELQKTISLIEAYEIKDLHLEKEEEKLKALIKEGLEHKDWRAVRKYAEIEKKEEKRVLRLESHELRELYSKFHGLMKLIKEDLSHPENKDKHTEDTKPYFVQLYKIMCAYEKIFRDLERKERLLYKRSNRKK